MFQRAQLRHRRSAAGRIRLRDFAKLEPPFAAHQLVSPGRKKSADPVDSALLVQKNFMKPTTPTSSHKQTSRADRTSTENTFPVINRSYQATAEAVELSPAIAQTQPVDLPPFRNLSRDVFGGKAHREYLNEAILFLSISCVAAWPLCVVIHQLGTMMISPPPGGIW
jgi:hypothetical protein